MCDDSRYTEPRYAEFSVVVNVSLRNVLNTVQPRYNECQRRTQSLVILGFIEIHFEISSIDFFMYYCKIVSRSLISKFHLLVIFTPIWSWNQHGKRPRGRIIFVIHWIDVSLTRGLLMLAGKFRFLRFNSDSLNRCLSYRGWTVLEKEKAFHFQGLLNLPRQETWQSLSSCHIWCIVPDGSRHSVQPITMQRLVQIWGKTIQISNSKTVDEIIFNKVQFTKRNTVQLMWYTLSTFLLDLIWLTI